MNSKLLTHLKVIYIIQYIAQYYNIYGWRFRSLCWTKTVFPLFVMYTTQIFIPFDEKQSHTLKKSKGPLVESILFVLLSLSLIEKPAVVSMSEFPYSSLFIQFISGALHALSLWAPQPNDLIAFSNLIKMPLAEGNIGLAFLWSIYLTYFFSIYPLLTTGPRDILYEPLPCLLHVLFCWVSSFAWLYLITYMHHRMQMVVDSRRCGVWALSPLDANKKNLRMHSWKAGAKYRQGDTVQCGSHVCKLVSPFSSYHLPPSASKLPFRKTYYAVLTAEAGPLHKSRMVAAILGVFIVNAFLTALAAFLCPRQQQVGFLVMACARSLLVYRFRSAFCCTRGSVYADDGYVYNPHGITSTGPVEDRNSTLRQQHGRR
mmetsp:Transcript_26412/g.39188  ORF Transcript_26412/g.39188 Transcript_26412/m.39188 type:complete len:372 (+) Transcript_26412:133-1248(+)|eukprot:CAMPEP_0185022998 /NCGR_PEP_ID=MMETSP1103-20130426/5703_1 /TAXON_ID=36769 /ORGANISM="Paraphysomonas bandaiensis, Strain Caron Lab Isolate" /LENGTH=371 /DNA_ID=CAMNT_0027555371 /DNA_START=133 /DNA_END=1248 /DNA_ORIENTATION=-